MTWFLKWIYLVKFILHHLFLITLFSHVSSFTFLHLPSNQKMSVVTTWFTVSLLNLQKHKLKTILCICIFPGCFPANWLSSIQRWNTETLCFTSLPLKLYFRSRAYTVVYSVDTSWNLFNCCLISPPPILSLPGRGRGGRLLCVGQNKSDAPR